MDVFDSLKIKILEAHNLIYVGGLPPSPYIEVSLGQNRKRTREVTETNNPKYFNEAPIIFEHILGDGYDTILLYVYHRDQFSDVDPCLGMSVIPLDTFYNSPKVEMDYWYDLTSTSGYSYNIIK